VKKPWMISWMVNVMLSLDSISFLKMIYWISYLMEMILLKLINIAQKSCNLFKILNWFLMEIDPKPLKLFHVTVLKQLFSKIILNLWEKLKFTCKISSIIWFLVLETILNLPLKKDPRLTKSNGLMNSLHKFVF
jgi:hypothetical protein